MLLIRLTKTVIAQYSTHLRWSRWSLRHTELYLRFWKREYRFISILETMIFYLVTLVPYVSLDLISSSRIPEIL